MFTTRLLTPKDIDNGIFKAVYSHFENAFIPDERRGIKDLEFTDADGKRIIRGLETLVKEQKLENSNVSFLCTFSGESEKEILNNPHEAFRAGSLFYIFPATNFVFVEYLFSAKEHMGKGYGMMLLVKRALKDYIKPAGVKRAFAEVEREGDFSNPTERKIAEERLKLFERLGGLPLLADYVQPNYSPEKKPVPLHPLLLNFDGEKNISNTEFINFMKAFYHDIYGLQTPNHQYITHIIDSIKGHEFVEQRESRYSKDLHLGLKQLFLER